MKHLLLLSLLLGGMVTLYAQNPARITIQGIIQDTTSTTLPAATVMLLQPKDSALVNFTRTDENGFFSFKNVKNTGYLLKVSYVSYLPFQQSIPVSATELVDLGHLRIKPIAKELLEVVIRAAKAPLSIRGDTIEYDATTFKVPPGSSVEDLLRRLPGIDVDEDGNIKAQGKDINKVLVDGKTFFGNDPKAATKNLGAEIISKVQVFNDKSEQAKLTGVDDGKREKAMNLELKDEFKKGAFGKITVASGTLARWAARGNYNRFSKKEQFSIISYGNNINETGVNWNDYEEFKGNNSFTSDNADFGFGYTSGSSFFFRNNEFTNNFDGRGFTKNFGGGVNYNYTHKKTQLSTSYFYNQTRLTLDEIERKQTFQSTGSFFTLDTTQQVNFRGNHSIGFRLEQMLDSSNTLIIKTNLKFGLSDDLNKKAQNYQNSEKVSKNELDIDNTNLLNTFSLNTSFIFRHKFQKKGRVVTLSGTYKTSTSDGSANLSSLNRFLEATDPNTQIRTIRQSNTDANQQHELKSSVFFLEPLSKRIYWESFYNFSHHTQTVDRNAYNILQANSRLDSLSTYYTSQILYNRLGSSIRYSHQGINITTGMAGLRYDLNGRITPSSNESISINRQFITWTPYLSIETELKNNTHLSGNYSMDVQAPQLSDLQPVIQNNNPYFISSGNPDLLPEKKHSFSGNLYKFNPNTFMNLWAGLDFNYYLSQIIYTQAIDKQFVTRTRPENISGGKDLSMYLGIRFPVVKTKLTMNINSNVNGSISPTYINGIENETDNRTYSLRTGLTLTPHEKLILNANASAKLTTIAYSIESQQNQRIRKYGVEGTIKWNFAKKFFFESNLNYTNYSNDRFGFNQNIPIMNASVRKLFLKDNKIEMRLAAFDLFNQRVNINQYGSQNFVVQQTAQTLARYFMLSLSYNIKGHSNKLQERGY